MLENPTLYRLSDAPPSLKEMQRMVGGYVELVTRWNAFNAEGEPIPHQLFANEEGRLMGLPYNAEASELWAQVAGSGVASCALVGNCVLLLGPACW